MAERDEFTEGQKDWAIYSNALWVAKNWPDDFKGKPPHYMCEECSFISPVRRDFAVDHVVSCASGGTRDRHPLDVRKRLYEGDTALLYQTGLQARVLCVGCNGAKSDNEFVPRGRGYAYLRHAQDCNPDHVYSGVPPL